MNRRPFITLRCDKCGTKTDHVMIGFSEEHKFPEETFQCQECGETRKIYELI